MTEINLGLTIPDGMMAPLDAKLNPDVIKDLCLFGTTLSWKDAQEKKVVDQVVPKNELLAHGIEFGEKLAPLGLKRDAYYGIKKSLWGL